MRGLDKSQSMDCLLGQKKVAVVERCSLGTLSNDDDDGSENVTDKMNLRSFKLNRVYLVPLSMSNAGDFSWSWILKELIQVQKEERKFVVLRPRPP